ncbi:MAG TPA: A/G-specific adenine glycosylase [Paracoccus sp. (in: a-proteobacteria)]|uniref:A/G-specific adenine glycosylase n=1 Tax=uncultured Paracoccus sp. TaxID=189685 RepID=UPI00261B15A8|nr:A/G-specific adenine glycosylase [uncultured Paracoccus sp.]HMQ40867.1 A/G-specific adenine glycosylase [Paracoccus sp. (in: a-proteobacteria)]HMR35029.1 A/G-specific adenine glycosylase [Paracoccus sp. (in: a-proteobacteria)]
MRDLSGKLLNWYDRHARALPWRVPPGQGRADPYRVWLSEIMLQQTTVAAVKAYFERFTTLWPSVEALAAADDARVMAEWAGLGYYARARNLRACAREVAAAGGRFPTDRAALQALPGIGPYTSAAIAAIAFDQPETVVDGNVERVVARLFAVETPLPAAKPELTRLAGTLTPQQRPGDFAQAMMDLGATICTPRSPACGICPLNDTCAARRAGIAAELPRRAPKAAKPRRQGIAWVVLNEDAVLLEQRPPKGLLGGTLAFPSTGWDGSDLPPPLDAEWQELGHVTHVFTHFALELQVMLAHATGNPQRGIWMPRRDFSPSDLPGLMRKVWARVEETLRQN